MIAKRCCSLRSGSERASADRTLHQVLQSLQRLFPILFLAAVYSRLDDDDPFLGNALVGKLQQLFFIDWLFSHNTYWR